MTHSLRGGRTSIVTVAGAHSRGPANNNSSCSVPDCCEVSNDVLSVMQVAGSLGVGPISPAGCYVGHQESAVCSWMG